MAAEEAVFTAAVARDEVRKSLLRMEYHMNRGPRGLRGVEREQKYLDALGRQAARLGAGTTGGVNVGAKTGLGTRARASLIARMNGNGVSAGRFRSSLLAEFSQDTMNGAREWTYPGDKTWIWVANASACAACLEEHGKRFTGAFTPMHPSCLCFPQDPTEAAQAGVRTLTSREIIETLVTSNNREFAAVGEAIRTGRLTIDEAARQATRRSSRGLARWAKTLRDQKSRAQGLADDATAAPAAPTTTPTAPQQQPTIIETPAPTVAEVREAIEEVADVAFDWLEGIKASSTQVTYSAKRHETTLRAAQNLLNRVVTSNSLKERINRGMRTLNKFETHSDTNKGRKTKWAGRFEHRRKGWEADSPTTYRGMRLQMRSQNNAALDEWNDLVTDYNARAKELSTELRTARNAARDQLRAQGVTYPKPFQVDELVDEDLWRRLDELQKSKPQKGKVGLTQDRPASEVAEILLHEQIHMLDEASGWQLSARAVADGIQEEFRRIAKSDDPFAAAFRYGAETGLGGGRGHETVAEVVRMYFFGPGVMIEGAGQPAFAWRNQYPKLAKWVEDNVL